MLLRPLTPNRPAGRRGAILIVVLALLTIFTVVAITFVFYSGSEADGARIHREGEASGNVDHPDPNDAVNRFVGTLLFDTDDTSPEALLNAVRGHSLARGIYGYTGTAGQNLTPFNGVGTFRSTAVPAGVGDRPYLVNHTVIGGTVYDPEYSAQRSVSGPGPVLPPAATPGNIYIPKNAPYTYVDANNLSLAAVSPQTGEVVVPSFFRYWQFNSGNGNQFTRLGPPSVDPSNTDWTAAGGRYKILRPRPVDQVYNSGDGRGNVSDFPYPPPNADGTYTGDVQNLPGGYNYNNNQFHARNDSIWVDIGLPPRLWNGKWVKPLVAALILDLDGRVNLSAHGNLLASGNHGSFAGYGPWEVNPNRVLNNVAEANALVLARQNNNPNAIARSGANQRGYAYTAAPPFPVTPVTLANYAGVNWSAASGTSIVLPGGASPYSTVPNYTGYGNGGEVGGHPALFNPAEWPAAAGNLRTFAAGDLKRLGGRFASDRELYKETGLANLQAPATPPNTSLIVGTPATYTGNNYRLDLVHRNRLSVTTHGATLDVPGLMPAASSPPSWPMGPTRYPSSTPGFYTAGGPTLPGFGGVDVNRPLTAYTVDPALAAADRQLLARDIFARLCLATGANVTVHTTLTAPYQPGDVQINGGATPDQVDALRYLAQLAANIVDYVDVDDANTMFVWNPVTPGPAGNVVADVANFQPAQVGTSVVFGIEKPRLVINEVYSEVANDPMEVTDPPGAGTAPTNPGHVRFWVELLNPASDPGATSPIGDGSVQLAGNVYRLQIARNGSAAAANLALRDNVTGRLFAPGTDPEVEYYFARLGGMPPPVVQPNNGNYDPAGNPTQGVVVFGPDIPPPGGMTGPQPFEFNPLNPGMGKPRPVWNSMVVSQAPNPKSTTKQNSLTYFATGGVGMGPPTRGNLQNDTYKRHLVALQRLAVPTLPPNDPASSTFNAMNPINPYVSIDYMGEVPAFDSVNRAAGQPKQPMPAQHVPMGSRFSVGKVQPYAGSAAQMTYNMDGTVTPAQYPVSFVLAQRATPAGEPPNTFGRHNGVAGGGPGDNVTPTAGGETILTPFEWPVHFDRPLVNQLELLGVAACRPHDLTQDLVRSPDGTNVRRDLTRAPWLGFDPANNSLPGFDAPNNRTNNGLYRALDVLRVKPWGHGVPMGGKVHGRVNINTIQDRRVFEALFDPQGGNLFNTGTVDTYWTNWIGSRTATMQARNLADGNPVPGSVPIPGQTVDEGGTDRPFKPFGVGELNSGVTPGPYTSGGGLQDTLLRLDTSTTVPTNYGGNQYLPRLWTTTQTHPYQQAEAARKVLNNVSYTSNTFVAFFTIGFFEVRTDSNGNPVFVTEATVGATNYNRPILGKEAFKTMPGDLRVKYCAVLDRNNIAVNPTDFNFFGAGNTATATRPFFTDLQTSVATGGTTITIAAAPDPSSPNQCLVYADGVPGTIGANSVLVLGTGPERTAVTVGAVANAGPGVYTLTLTAPLLQSFSAGTLVSNARLGNPGPQAGFEVVSTANHPYRAVVPYLGPVR